LAKPEEVRDKKESKAPNSSRRNFLKAAFVLSLLTILAGVADLMRYFSPAALKIPPWPRVKVANIKDLQLNKPLSFEYPLTDTSNYIVKLGKKVQNGIGPDQDIIAVSTICQHLGCIVHFEPAGRSDGEMPQFTGRPVAYCPCHGGVYDLDAGASVLAGPPPYPLPFVKLEYDEQTGDIYAAGMTPPVIFGKGSPGSSDTDLDLLGGTPV
jgi:arsenite oxidase small subunit